MGKNEKKSFAKLETLNFKPDASALAKVTEKGWKAVETTIVEGKAKVIIEGRTLLVEQVYTAIGKLDDEIKKMEPKTSVSYGLDRQKIESTGVFSDSELKQLEKLENKRNSLVKGLNTVMADFSEDSFKKLTEAFKKAN